MPISFNLILEEKMVMNKKENRGFAYSGTDKHDFTYRPQSCNASSGRKDYT